MRWRICNAIVGVTQDSPGESGNYLEKSNAQSFNA